MRVWTGILPKDCVIKMRIFDVVALCPEHGRSMEVPAPELRSFRISVNCLRSLPRGSSKLCSSPFHGKAPAS